MTTPNAISTNNHSVYQETLCDFYQATRQQSERLIAHLSDEDCLLQSMPDASPAKWHLAHTSWFFESFILLPRGTKAANPAFQVLFNSYYNGIGEQFSRPQRGILSRPSLQEVKEYRSYIDSEMQNLLTHQTNDIAIKACTELGIHHEKQHQELLLMDIKHAFSENPLYPSYSDGQMTSTVNQSAPSLQWMEFTRGIYPIGAKECEFAYDNERPYHQQLVYDFKIATRPSTNGEFLEFILADGYTQAEHWLSDGWAQLKESHANMPLYWKLIDNEWYEFTLHGLQKLNLAAPVCHINYYEACAFASWSGKRLPSEFEWEVASRQCTDLAHYYTHNQLHPQAFCSPFSQTVANDSQLKYMFGTCWEWTSSAYAPYPGFKPLPGAVGEYNGKFMSNQYVLRGGSCLSPHLHIRATYRNFFYANQAWMMSGIRLAEDLK